MTLTIVKIPDAIAPALRGQLRWRSLQRSPDPYVDLVDLLLRDGGARERVSLGRRGKRRGRQRKRASGERGALGDGVHGREKTGEEGKGKEGEGEEKGKGKEDERKGKGYAGTSFPHCKP